MKNGLFLLVRESCRDKKQRAESQENIVDKLPWVLTSKEKNANYEKSKPVRPIVIRIEAQSSGIGLERRGNTGLGRGLRH